MPKRGLIVLVLTWSVLLFAPIFRAQMRRMRAPLSSQNTPWPYPPLLNEMELARLTREHPADATLALAQFELQNRERVKDNNYWRQFDALVNRFPDALNVRSAKLIKATSGGLVRRTYEPLPPNLSRFDIERAEFLRKWQNAAQRAILVEQARVGARQAPDNGFFGWIEAMALWNRDDEPALRALQNAARRTQFDDGLMANQRALIRWREKQGPLAWDEKLASVYAVLLPHLAQLRTLQREVIWSGIARYRRGDKAGAYRRWRIALESAGAMRRAYSHGPQANYIGLLVGQALQEEVWNTVAKELNSPANFNAGNPPKNWQLGAFQALARRDDQNAIADFAARERADFQSKIINPGRTMTAYETALGVSRTSTRLSFQLPWLEQRVFNFSVVAALGLAICWLLRRFSEAEIGRVSAGQIAFFGALWLGVLGLAAFTRIGPELQIFSDLSGIENSTFLLPWIPEILEKMSLVWLGIALTLACAIALCYWQNAREDWRLQKQVLRGSGHVGMAPIWLSISLSLTWILVALLLILSCAVNRSNDATLIGVSCALVLMLALGLTLLYNERFSRGDKQHGRLAILSAFCALFALLLASIFGVFDNDPIAIVIALLLLCALASLIYLAINSRDWRSTFMRALAIALQTLGGVAAVCAVAFLLASLAALPVRTRQNRIVDDYIKRGEIDWMRSQMQTRNASAP